MSCFPLAHVLLTRDTLPTRLEVPCNFAHIKGLANLEGWEVRVYSPHTVLAITSSKLLRMSRFLVPFHSILHVECNNADPNYYMQRFDLAIIVFTWFRASIASLPCCIKPRIAVLGTCYVSSFPLAHVLLTRDTLPTLLEVPCNFAHIKGLANLDGWGVRVYPPTLCWP